MAKMAAMLTAVSTQPGWSAKRLVVCWLLRWWWLAAKSGKSASIGMAATS